MVPDHPWGRQKHLGWKESLSETRFSECTDGVGDQEDLSIHVNFNRRWDIQNIGIFQIVYDHTVHL